VIILQKSFFRSHILALALALAWEGTSGANSFSKPKAGLWESSVDSPLAGKSKQSFCVDTQFEWPNLVPAQHREECKQSQIKSSQEQVSFELECRPRSLPKGSVLKNKVRIWGNPASQVSLEIQAAMQMPGFPNGAGPEMVITGTSRWIGPCPKK
jgi:Protein of unknown function (DUF3617)